MITERALKKWRREALTKTWIEYASDPSQTTEIQGKFDELNKRILQMSQELLDQHLMRRN